LSTFYGSANRDVVLAADIQLFISGCFKRRVWGRVSTCDDVWEITHCCMAPLIMRGGMCVVGCVA
jgi:hypothetical protein